MAERLQRTKSSFYIGITNFPTNKPNGVEAVDITDLLL